MSSSKKLNVAGWVVSGLVSVFLLVSSAGKFGLMPNPEMEATLNKLGWTQQSIFPIGFIEVSVVLLFLIPRTAFLGALLLAAYMGGAVATHARVGDPQFVGGILVGFVAWVGYALRRPDVIKTAFSSPQER